jgi:hypothetical protein
MFVLFVPFVPLVKFGPVKFEFWFTTKLKKFKNPLIESEGVGC